MAAAAGGGGALAVARGAGARADFLAGFTFASGAAGLARLVGAAGAGLAAAGLLALVRLGAARLVLRAAGAAFLVDLRADAVLPREAVLRRTAGFTAVFLRLAATRLAVFLVDFLADFFFADFDFRAIAIMSSCFR